MFDLEQQLEGWKTRFAGLEAMRSGDIEELEQHVRDSMAALTSLGLNPEEAFVVATHRVGAPGPVGREFAIVNGSHVWSRRVFWMAAGALGYVVCGLVIGAIASIGQVIALLAGLRGAAVGYTAAGITGFGWSVLAVLVYRRWKGHSRSQGFAGLSAGVIGSLATLAIVVASVTKLGSQVVLPRLMPVPELGQALTISNAAAMVSTVLMPLVLLMVMLSLGRHMTGTGAADQPHRE